MRTEITPQQSLLSQYTSKPALIQEIEDRLQRDDRLGINIGLEEGLLLRSLCGQKHVEKVVEIGTQYGCSASWMAYGLGSKGRIHTFEKDPQCIENAKITFANPQFLNTGCQVQLHSGDALEELAKITSEGPFDLVFIDANKSAYCDYLEWAKANLNKGGLIVADNIYLFGTMFAETCPDNVGEKMWKTMKQFLNDIFSDSHYAVSIVPTKEGLLLASKI